jgi:hypothetical protein
LMPIRWYERDLSTAGKLPYKLEWTWRVIKGPVSAVCGGCRVLGDDMMAFWHDVARSACLGGGGGLNQLAADLGV